METLITENKGESLLMFANKKVKLVISVISTVNIHYSSSKLVVKLIAFFVLRNFFRLRKVGINRQIVFRF